MKVPVMIHCLMGMNRSAALVIALLVVHYNMSLFDAVRNTTRKLGRIIANDGFRKQLVEFVT
jgi:atypical dual specificity phosphatase